ncbi:MAG: DEAD/DEAH box helicase family protein [Verrucomicrobia bacterium]|nr:DEAD/DEAH box helicase family protein [Verrucomicrobiota bacterium]
MQFLDGRNKKIKKKSPKIGLSRRAAGCSMPDVTRDLQIASQPSATAVAGRAVRVDRTSAVADKIALFRALFRGREEVYARRFTSGKTGRAGYQPVCGNEWVRGVCEKPKIRCGECACQRFLPVSDEVVRWHLSGADERGREFVMGLYPMLLDERCWLLAADLDGEHWREDAAAMLTTCRKLAIPALLERSRSGNGGHLWWFFAEAVPAVLARKLGAHLLTETMERRPEVGLRSYDRFFPNQDTLPSGGFGNLIALPLQKAPREAGNSVFVDDALVPYEDPWAVLAGVERITLQRLEEIVTAAEGRGRIVGVRLVTLDEDEPEPWAAPPSRQREALPTGEMPATIELVLGDQIYLPKAGLGPSLRNALVRLAAFQNPEFYRAQAMRLPTYDKPRIVACAEDHPLHLALPRGCFEEVMGLLASLHVAVAVRDERCHGRELAVEFCGTLREEQQQAGAAMLAHDTGVLAATTAFGKTVLAAWLIAQRRVNTLILVHRQQLLEQWVERLSQFLGMEPKAIGRWGGGRKKLTGNVDVALIQSVIRKDVVQDLVADYGHLVVDECHHLSARSFELVARRAKARYVTGLSATVTRKDGHHPIIFMQCGPVRHKVDARRQAAERPFSHEVWVRSTGWLPGGEPAEDKRVEFQRLCDAVVHAEFRNRMICAEVVEAVRAGRSPVVLTERTEHLQLLAGLLGEAVPHVITLQGGMGRKALLAALERVRAMPPAAGRVLIATGRFLGEGFDDARLDTLFLTMPVSWHGTIAQYVGRLHRLHDGKRTVRVYDYADLDVPMLSRMFNKRCAGYEAVGYTILLPASALPGWPAEVPLPVDTQWKHDYAASVRRLIRDGVDRPLAQLFLHATTSPAAGAEGAARARSASEAFLYRRLESLPDLAGVFRLNAVLPIPFDERSQMEVDFLAAEPRLVLEIDGGQHLGEADAWRRDRRKDAALQANGYFVLRFLAADLGTHLDTVLDTVLRTLAFRRRG